MLQKKVNKQQVCKRCMKLAVADLHLQSIRAGKTSFKKVFSFLYEDRTRKYDPKAHEKHPIHGTPYLTKDKSPVSEEEHHVKNEDEIDESHK